MKFKPKQILKRIVTSAVALVTATSLAVTSLALGNETSEGITGSGAYGSQIYQWINNKNIRWMFEAYVSTTDDGTIDVTKNSLGGNNDGQLKRIGAILYFNGMPSNSVILPAGTTTDKRNTTDLNSIYNSSTGEYRFPQSTASVEPENPYYHGQTFVGRGDTRYYISTEDCGLPKDINNIDYSAQVRPIVESPEFTELMVRTLKESLGSDIYTLIKGDSSSPGISPKVLQKVAERAKTTSQEEALSHLFPDSDDSYVQWAIVITPLSIHYANSNCAHWIISTKPLSIIKNGTYYAMDAWTLSVYNLLTTYIGSMTDPLDKNNAAAATMRNQITSQGITADFYTSTGVPNGKGAIVKPRLHGAIGASENTVFYNCFTDTYTSKSNVSGADHYLGILTTESNELKQRAYDSEKAFYLGDKWRYLAQRGGIGVALSDPPENKDSTVYHHICNIKITLPKDAKTFDYNGHKIKLTSVNVKNMLMGKPFIDVDGNTIKQFNFTMIDRFLQFCIDNKYMSKDISSSSSCWEEPLSYVVDPTKLDKKGYYFASKDEEFLSQMEARGYPYIMVSSELTTSGKLSNVYTGPESGDKDRVVWRYAADNDDKFTSKESPVEGQLFYKVDLDLYTVCRALVETFCNGGSGTSDRNGRVIFNDQGLQAKPGDEYHTASFIVTVEEAPTDIYYHTATYDVKLKPGEPVPTFVTELIDRIEDGPTWSVEKSDKPITDPQWKPSSDPVLKQVQGNITTGYVVGVSGFQDKFNPQPSKYPDTSSAVLKLEKSELAFDPIPKPIDQVFDDNTIVDISNSGIAELHTAIIKFNITEARQLEKGTDRIKTYDVTQFIDQTVDAVSDSEHLKPLTTDEYVDREESYNSSVMSGSHADKTLSAAIESKIIPNLKENLEVHATNYVGGLGDIACSGAHHNSHSVYAGPDENGNPTYDERGGYDCGAIYFYACRYTQETPVIAYGLDAGDIQHYKDVNAKLVEQSNTTPKSLLNNSLSTVGLTIPHAYYTSPEVVKLHNSTNWSNNEQPQFLLPKTTGSEANKFAVFDTMFNTDGEGSYRIKYFSGKAEVTHQSHKMSKTDIERDYNSQTGYTDFDYLDNGDGISINGVQYIAHRDLLSGDGVSTSLAVSSYMAKYATKSDTYAYLEFMRDSGFAFNVSGDSTNKLPDKNDINPVGANRNIDHANRTVWIARAATTEELEASEDGYKKNAYNTHYVGAEPNRRNDTFIRFGLGGASADGKNMYSNFIKNSTSLSNSSLDKVDDGDALRSIWYTASIDKGDPIGYCSKLANSKGHDEHCSECSAKHTCKHLLHSTENEHKNWHSVSNNNYVLYDTYLPNGIYEGHTVYNNVGQQTDMFEDIYTSRITFRIPLAVEGTTNGIWDATGAKGIKYNTDILKLKDGYLTHKSVSELSDATNQKNQRTYEQTTFEVLKQNYADVGSEKQPGDEKTLLAEYRFTTPTAPFHFNPSVAMAFDDKFEDNNKSVWMLSTQPREITFKNILDIRLTYNAKDGDKDRKADSGYPTTVTSEWSTDKLDKDIQKATGLPTMKASNSYKTETSAVGGTITAYVVLQDPEFAPNYQDAVDYNEKTMNLYKNQLEDIRKQITNAGGTITNPDKNAFGPAMYTNMTNGSSTNSMFYQDPFTSSDVLADKEPMKLLSSTKFTSKLTSGSGNKDINTSATEDSAWSFYALAGHEVVNNYGDPRDTDISDTTSSKNRKIFGQQIKSQTDALSHQKTQLDELNKYLKELMFEQGNSVNAPQDTKPFKDGSQEFVWYNEDYEGFVVAVYEIEFAIGGTGGEVSNPDANSHAKTDFHSVYRSESDWKTDTNATIEETERSLVADYSETLQNMGIVNIVNSTGKNDFSFKDGKLDLVTVDGRKQLKDWEKELSKYNYHGEIYGIGLELANLQVEFGDIKKQPISFFYQPTYFNIRGSVYDTVR